jgi:methylmalonyl-CoA/ethylmalonyl-CoA epimerase
MEVTRVDVAVETLEAAGVTVVDQAERDGYAEAFVPPGAANGVLYQLMEYLPDYTDDHGARSLIGGAPLCAEDG